MLKSIGNKYIMKNRHTGMINKFRNFHYWVFTFILFFGLLACNEIVKAGDIEVSAPRTVEVGGQFQISFSLSERPKKFDPPTIEGATIIAGPSTMSSQSVQNINGKVSAIVTFTLSYYVKADKEGKISVGSDYLADEYRRVLDPDGIKPECSHPHGTEFGIAHGDGPRGAPLQIGELTCRTEINFGLEG